MSSQPVPFYEPFLQRHFPKWGAQRSAFRAAGAMSTARGALVTRVGNPWNTGQWAYRGGTLSERYDLATMRDRGRTAYRDNPIARALVDVETENIVAEGFSLHARTDDPEFNAEAEDRWAAFMEQADLTDGRPGGAFQQHLWRAPRIDGDGGIILVDRFGQAKLQYVPGDRIKTPDNRINDLSIVDGVEVDATMRPVRFHIETLDVDGKRDFAAVDADNFKFPAFLDYGVPLAVRGMTCFNTVFALLDQLDGIVDAVAIAVRLQAAIGLVFKQENASKVMQGMPYATNSEGKDQRVITIENGSLKFSGPNDSIEGVHATQPLPQLPDFVRLLNRIIANAFGMPIEIANRDLSQVNFSGGRIGMQNYQRRCRMWQRWFTQKVLSPIYRWWLSRELARGRFKRTPPGWREPGRFGEWTAHEFTGRSWDNNDPLTETQARHLELATGLTDEFRASAELGRDYETILANRKRAKNLRTKYEIEEPPLPSTTRETKTAVTAVDADGNPINGSPTAPLNGIQITSALDVLTKVTEKLIEPATAIELITRLNISPERAQQMVAAASSREGISAGDRDFQREVLKSLLGVPGAREAIYNLTDIEDLAKQSGLPPEKGIEAPFLPVVSPAGQLVSGAVIKDSDGAIVGGDVVEPKTEPSTAPAPAPDESNPKKDNNDAG